MSQDRLLSACYSFLVPVARFLLRHGIGYREFDELARTAFIDVATTEFGLRGRPTNVSRISAITGIPRKEVSKVRGLLEKFGSTPRNEISPLGDVLHHWYTDDEFIDDDGEPLPLELDGEGRTFTALVKLCSGDLPAGALKSELLRIGAIELTADKKLKPVRRQAVPVGYDDKLITSLSFNLFGLASTIAYNSNPKRTEPSRPERFIESENISESTRSEMRASLRERIEKFAIEIDDLFSTVETPVTESTKRIAVGIYYFEEDT